MFQLPHPHGIFFSVLNQPSSLMLTLYVRHCLAHLHGPSLHLLWYDHVFAVLRSPRVDTVVPSLTSAELKSSPAQRAKSQVKMPGGLYGQTRPGKMQAHC